VNALLELPAREQQRFILSQFGSWKRGLPQADDVLLGIKV